MSPSTRNSPSFLGKVAGYLGFSKTYNFLLYFVFGGALLGFSLARLQYLDIDGIYCGGKAGSGAAPGECYYYRQGLYKAGMLLHLATILPAGLLVILQFVPIIRRKAIIFHKLNGYAVLLLAIASFAGIFIITRISFGGELSTQTAVGFLALVSIFALVQAYVGIKRSRIDQHRAWMLRAWFYIASIITVRIIMISAATIISAQKNYFTVRPCAQLEYTVEDRLAELYPSCNAYLNGTDPLGHSLVRADMSGNAAQVGAALGMSFGMGVWLALAIHAIGIEIYIALTPAEAQRLRELSAAKRAAARGGDQEIAASTSDRADSVGKEDELK